MRKRMFYWRYGAIFMLFGLSCVAIAALFSMYLYPIASLYVVRTPSTVDNAPWFLTSLASMLIRFLGSSAWIFALVPLLFAGAFLFQNKRHSLQRVAAGVLFFAISWLLYGALLGYSTWGDPFYGGFSWVIPGGVFGSFFWHFFSVDFVTSLFGIFFLALFGAILLVSLHGVSFVGRCFIFFMRALFGKLCYVFAHFYQSVIRQFGSPAELFRALKKRVYLQKKMGNESSIDVAFWNSFSVDEGHQDVEESAVAAALNAYAVGSAIEEDAGFVLPSKKLFVVSQKKQEQEVRAKNEVENRVSLLEKKLEVFGIAGKVTRSERGPVVTLLEYMPAPDVTVNRISARAGDVALALGALSLRVIAPIPGKMVVGFEISNEQRQVVYFSELFDSSAYKNFTGAVPAVIGAHSDGSPCILDMVQQPHMLIAGSTGSGKSVVMHALILGMLSARTPDELRLVMIDPKRLEFASYADIPHLLIPIVTDLNEVTKVFTWLVHLMEERYAKMASLGVRSIDEYCEEKGRDSMPYIMVFVDELADIMVTVGREVEPLMIRLAQMARAAGIHLIFATQRPSVDVITGVMKVNFPTRIALKVVSKIDSRTIIDIPGAEQLLGKGDMLLMQQGGHVARAHGAFVQSKEVHAVASYLRMQQKPVYEVIEQLPTDNAFGGSTRDALYLDVLDFLKQRKDVSISLLQRQFKIGFNRSARLIDLLEEEGRISSIGSGKVRRVLHKG